MTAPAQPTRLTVKPRTMQIGHRSSPAGFDVVDEHGEPYAWTWHEERARLIAAAPALLAFVEKCERAGAMAARGEDAIDLVRLIEMDAKALLAEIRGAR